jgi:hypothetical protein
MAKVEYSKELCARLFQAPTTPRLKCGHRRTRYEPGDELTVDIKGVHPSVEGSATLAIDKFLGGGFAGQVYRVRLAALNMPEGATIEGLEAGKLYAVKIIIPPIRLFEGFRNTVLAGVSRSVQLAGELRCLPLRPDSPEAGTPRREGNSIRARNRHQRCVRLVLRSGSSMPTGKSPNGLRAVCGFSKPTMNSRAAATGETVPLSETRSPEYIAKRRFMADMVAMMHEMGCRRSSPASMSGGR